MSISACIILSMIGGTTTLSQERTDELKQRLQEWIAALETCSASYQLTTTNFGTGVEPQIEELFEYRYGHGDIYLLAPWTKPETGDTGTLLEVLKSGSYSNRFDRASDKERGVNGIVALDVGGWRAPDYIYSMPHEWFGYFSAGKHNRFIEALNECQLIGFEASGREVLSCWLASTLKHTPFDIYFDSTNKIVQIDFVMRNTVGSLEQLREFWDGDPLDFGLVKQRFEFYSFVDIDGFCFPTHVRDSSYRLRNDAVNELMEKYDAGLISDNEYRLAVATMAPRFEPMVIREVFVDLETLVVNNPLPAGSFEIPLDTGSLVSRGDDPELLRVSAWYELEYWQDMYRGVISTQGIIVLCSILGFSFSLIAIVYRRRRLNG